MDYSNIPSDAEPFSMAIIEQAEREMARMAAMDVPATIVIQQDPLPPWMTQEQWQAEIVRRLEEHNEQLRRELGELGMDKEFASDDELLDAATAPLQEWYDENGDH